MNRKVLLTGATGFVGRHILRVLLEQGADVRCVTRSGCNGADLISGVPVEWVATRDLFAETPEGLRDLCQDVHTLIHAAWYVEPGKYLTSPLNLECLTGTLNLARAAAGAGVRRFLGLGTCFEYDLAGGVVSRETALRPTTPYAAAKAAVYLALSQYLPIQSVEFAWCRLFYLYGDGEDPRRLVPYLHERLSAGKEAELTSGRQIRDFLDVREAARRIVDAALGSQQGCVHICSGVPITVRQLAEQVADIYGRRDLLRFGVRPDNLVDPPCVVGLP